MTGPPRTAATPTADTPRATIPRDTTPRARVSRRWDLRLYILQRASALVMAPLVLGHLAVMIYAIRNGLSAAEILGRTQGSLFWALFYGLFVVAAAVHAAIGLRTVVRETTGWRGRGLDGAALLVAVLVLVLGLRAVTAVIVGPVGGGPVGGGPVAGPGA